MSKPTTISFVGTTEIKSWLERWAKEDDRSISYIIRQILEKEVRHRTADLQSQNEQTNHKH